MKGTGGWGWIIEYVVDSGSGVGHGPPYFREVSYSDRYIGDIFSYLPFGYLRDLGSLGQPSEVLLYGNGFSNISYLEDGILLNNRSLNSYDLNNFQSEYIDSLEVVPLPRGFLYGTNNTVAVNFITRDKIPLKPYSRIRFYQAPDNEGMIDGIFNAYLMDRFNFSFEVTNNSVDSRYTNSEYGGWKASARIRYLLSNKINIVGNYSYSKLNTQLNGGVNIDAIPSGQVNTILYDPIQAPVNYTSRYQKFTSHFANLKFLGRFSKSFNSELTLYYYENLTEYRQNEKGLLTNIPVIINDNSDKTFGGRFRQKFSTDPFTLDLTADYERTEYSLPVINLSESTSNFSVSGKLSTSVLNGLFYPSAYLKYLKYRDESYSGFGADINLYLTNYLTLYAGVSKFQKPLNPIEEQLLDPAAKFDKQNITTMEAGIKLVSGNIKGSVSLFNIINDNETLPAIVEYTDTLKIDEIGIYKSTESKKFGINLSLRAKIWKVLLTVNGSYYNSKLNSQRNYLIPDFTFEGGLYYVDTLFNSNLNLKTGVNLKYSGNQDYFSYDFQQSQSVKYYTDGTLPYNTISQAIFSPSFQADFSLVGTIQKKAIVYFVVENLFDNNYFIVPYYPKQGRGMRFGVAWEFLD
jgi:hypothetical protein